MFLLALLPVALATPPEGGGWSGPPVGCTAAVPPSTLRRYLTEAELRLGELDDEGFAAAATAAAAAAPCLGSSLPADDAALWHRVMGVLAYTKGERAAAAAQFRAYVALTPGGSLPPTYAGEGGTLTGFFRDSVAAPEGSPPRPLTPPPGYAALLDGAPATVLPSGRAGLVQLAAGDGTVVTTWALDGDDEAPDLGSVLATATARAPLPTTAAERHPVGLAVASAVTATLAGGAYATSWALRARFDDVTVNPVATEDLTGLRAGTNATAAAAPALGAVALALGIVTVVRW